MQPVVCFIEISCNECFKFSQIFFYSFLVLWLLCGRLDESTSLKPAATVVIIMNNPIMPNNILNTTVDVKLIVVHTLQLRIHINFANDTLLHGKYAASLKEIDKRQHFV